MSQPSAPSRRNINTQPHIPAPHLVQSPHDFAAMMAHLRHQSILALDTESDSLYRYTPRVCLIQISAYADGANHPSVEDRPVVDYLVDPLKLQNLDALRELLANPSVEVVLHAAENDIILLHRDFDFRVAKIFDTQLAARILGRNGVGLAAMLEEEFGVISDKSMQRTDWGRRPLTPQQMTYAQIDTHYLLPLRLRQIQLLQAEKRWREAQEAFELLTALRYEENATGRTVWSMKNNREVEREQTGLLEELWLWREQTAQRLERPPFKVLNDSVLIELTNRAPHTLGELQRIAGLSSHQVERFGRDLLQAIERGKRRPLPNLPPPNPRPEYLLTKSDQRIFQTLRQWRSQTAEERGVDPDIIFSNDILLQIVEKKPHTLATLQEIPAIGPWKAETYGPAILRLLK
ncbi:MAG: HRDC domain-containing protein [Caldilineaceae bacterium]|nr:HRDC domain-containing protein [Caldilineaceae bacterium]